MKQIECVSIFALVFVGLPLAGLMIVVAQSILKIL